MKKCIFILILIFFLINGYSQNIPEEFYGIWESKDRYVFIEKNETEKANQIVIYLKTYYGWYVDRTVEPKEYDEIIKRTRNNSTPKNAEQVFFEILPINQNNDIIISDDSLAFEINLIYSKNEIHKIPVTVINQKIYLDFYIQDTDDKSFYRGNAVSKGIKVSTWKIPENVSCLYFLDDTFFDIRYWLTDMDYEKSKVSLDFEDKTFLVDKHIFSSGCNYSCVSGKSKKIRNVQPPFIIQKSQIQKPFEPYFYYNIEENDKNIAKSFFFNKDKTIIVFDKEPYLTKLVDKNDFNDLMQIVKSSNSRRKPPAESLFAEKELDWHWDLIDYIEKDDKIIQEVRKRQKEFGPREKDLK